MYTIQKFALEKHFSCYRVTLIYRCFASSPGPGLWMGYEKVFFLLIDKALFRSFPRRLKPMKPDGEGEGGGE